MSTDGFRRQRRAKKNAPQLTISAIHECITSTLPSDSLELNEYLPIALRELARIEQMQNTTSVVEFWQNACATTLSSETQHRIELLLSQEVPIYACADVDKNNDLCEACGLSAYFTEDAVARVCTECGASSDIAINSNDRTNIGAVAYGTEYMPPSGMYKRSAHLIEFLNQIQGECSSAITPENMAAVREQLRKMRIEPAETSLVHIRDALKRLGLAKLYEHTPNILTQIKGNAHTIKISPHLVLELQNMFEAMQHPFQKVAKKSQRKNMLSYSYVMRKCCQLIGVDDLLPYLPLLKSRTKVEQLDNMWREICNDLGWEFIPSV